MSRTNEPYWDIQVNQGDLIHVQTQREHAILEVKGLVGNRIIYDCIISNEEYYGSSDDDSILHKETLNGENFWIEQAE